MASFKDLDRLLQGFVDSGVPGCTLHVTQHGKMIYDYMAANGMYS